MDKKIKLGLLADIPIGDARGSDPLNTGKDQLFVVRQGNTYFAYLNACPHKGYEGTSLCWKKDRFLNPDKTKIVCSGHGAHFSIANGQCVAGPCKEQQLTSATVINDDGVLYWLKQ
ncbi:Rieske (2Fe-2S) protein [Halioxenophilus aromaticivorans]|uniref:Rieske (2Fe-2S) protein n=1 Tax=Halioxenophilus aromaticivorans TaxID=1306992 RepID=UPI0031EE9AC0